MKELRVAKSGKNAETATDPNDFIFHSGYNTFKILREGSATATLAASGSEQSYAINYPEQFAPFVFGFCKFASGRVAPPGSKANNADFWFTRLVVFHINTEIMFYYFNNTGGDYTVTFKYYVCESPIE